VALSLTMVVCFWRASVSNRKLAWMMAAGFLLGLIFLTKAEVFFAALFGAIAALGTLLWSMNPSPARLVKLCSIFAACAIAPALIATILMIRALPISGTVSALAGSWKWIGEERLGQISYFKWMMGTEQPWLSVARMCAWCGVYLSLMAISGGIAFAARKEPSRTRVLIASILAIANSAPIVIFWPRIPWRGFLRPLPIAMLGILIVLIVRLRRKPRDETAPFVLPISFTVLAGALLVKIALNAHSYHYGFALAMPATMVFVTLLVSWAPQVISATARAGGDCPIVRTAMIAALLAAGYAHLRISGAWLAKRGNPVGAKGDFFYAAEYGQYTQQAIEFINANTKPTDTLVCMPEGLLINFMTRRISTTPDMNFNPISLIMYGEENMLSRLQQHPPDWIALVGEDTSIYDAQFFGRDYARRIAAWIHENYEPAKLCGALPFTSEKLGIFIMRRKTMPVP
jgi:hypothetical protein